jgi:hypothetical protein
MLSGEHAGAQAPYKIIGGDIGYHYVVDGQYQIRLHIYQVCDADSVPQVNILVSSPDTVFTSYTVKAKMQDMGDVTFACPDLKIVTTCQNPKSSIPGIREYLATADVKLDLSNVCEYNFSWQGPDRFDTSAGAPQSIYLEAYLNACLYPATGSPEFDQKPFFYYTQGKCNTKYNSFLDSTYTSPVSYRFALVPPHVSKVNAFIYHDTSLSYTNPFHARLSASGCGLFELDSLSGKTTLFPIKTESSFYAIRLNKYTNRVLVSSVTRDVQYFAINVPKDRDPVLSGVNGTSKADVTFYAGKDTCFTIASFDPDVNDSVKLISYLFLGGGNFSLNSETGKKWPKITFCWEPKLSDIDTAPYILTLVVADNVPFCEDLWFPGITTKQIRIHVSDSTLSGIHHLPSFNNLRIYPQPSQDIVHIRGVRNISLLRLYDFNGRQIPIESHIHGNETLINTARLSSGMYFLQISDGQAIQTEKISIVH